MMKIGIFGGTFDPVHNEHVSMASNAVKELNLDKLIVIPTYISPHKIGKNVTSGEDRLNMLKAAFSGDEKIEVSSYELDKGGVSYTYETILHFKNTYPLAEIYFLMGSDMLENFPTWKNPDVIIKNSTLVLTKRNNGNYNDDALRDVILKKYGAKVLTLNFTGGDISSTKIRVYAKLGLNISEFTPKNVADYISLNLPYKNYYYDFVKSKLKQSRLYHTANVILTALSLCKNADVDASAAELAALLHDVAKYENSADYPVNLKGVPKSVEHQYVGAYIVENVLKINDRDIVNAVKYHTTGRVGMSNLEKLVFTADLIEPSRTFDGVDRLRELVFEDFFNGFNVCANELYKYLLKSGDDVFYLTKECAEYYKKEIKYDI